MKFIHILFPHFQIHHCPQSSGPSAPSSENKILRIIEKCESLWSPCPSVPQSLRSLRSLSPPVPQSPSPSVPQTLSPPGPPVWSLSPIVRRQNLNNHWKVWVPQSLSPPVPQSPVPHSPSPLVPQSLSPPVENIGHSKVGEAQASRASMFAPPLHGVFDTVSWKQTVHLSLIVHSCQLYLAICIKAFISLSSEKFSYIRSADLFDQLFLENCASIIVITDTFKLKTLHSLTVMNWTCM